MINRTNHDMFTVSDCRWPDLRSPGFTSAQPCPGMWRRPTRLSDHFHQNQKKTLAASVSQVKLHLGDARQSSLPEVKPGAIPFIIFLRNVTYCKPEGL